LRSPAPNRGAPRAQRVKVELPKTRCEEPDHYLISRKAGASEDSGGEPPGGKKKEGGAQREERKGGL